MPIGSFSAFGKVIQGVLASNPKTILDLGIGFGMNGAGVRNWLDLGIEPFKTKLVGVEVFPDYGNATWDLYDHVHINDIKTELEYCVMMGIKYDTIIMTDVIEHFTKEEGLLVLNMMKEVCNVSCIVSTPGIWIEQGAAYGNDHETHRSLWTVEDFKGAGFGIVMDGSLDNYGHMMIVADYIKPTK